jgi:hypothetical protein
MGKEWLETPHLCPVTPLSESLQVLLCGGTVSVEQDRGTSQVWLG